MNKQLISLIVTLAAITLVALAVYAQPAQAEVCGPNNYEDVKWVRFVSLSGKYGQAGIGWISFVANNLAPEKATLTIKGLGNYPVQGLSCTCGNHKTCTGYITGLPFGGTAVNYTGKLTVEYDEKIYTSTAPRMPIPPLPAP
ncbi:MAG: hypothetical protein ISS57_14000 [Anaerolineales bacterium]|nr:hypothetical protein [Anaerolineales bacterium]